MKKRTKRILLRLCGWLIFAAAIVAIVLSVKASKPNVYYGFIDKYLQRHAVDGLGEIKTVLDITDYFDPQTQIAHYAISDLQEGACEKITYDNTLFLINDGHFAPAESLSPLLETTALDGYGEVTMVSGAAESLRALLDAAEAACGKRFTVGASFIDGKQEEADVGDECYMTAYYHTSEHLSGTSVDLYIDGVTQKEYMTDVLAQWLMDHAWRYGFVIRYPFLEGEWTGVFFQPWHIRYVGALHAALLYDSGMPLEEYLQKHYLQEEAFYSVEWTRDGVTDTYLIFCQVPYEGTLFVPTTLADVSVSYDNTYGFYYVTGRYIGEVG